MGEGVVLYGVSGGDEGGAVHIGLGGGDHRVLEPFNSGK